MTVDKQDVIERALDAFNEHRRYGDGGGLPAHMKAAIRVVLEDMERQSFYTGYLPTKRGIAVDDYAASIGIKLTPDQPGVDPLQSEAT